MPIFSRKFEVSFDKSNGNNYFSGDGEETEESIDRSNSTVSNVEEHGEQSHLIVWQVQCPLSMPTNG